jgi:hypothetical protein
MPTVADLRQTLVTRWRAVEAGPFFRLGDPPPLAEQVLPPDYLALIEEFGGREGFLGSRYLRLYRFNELVNLNLAYDVPTNYPEGFLFGSDGCGEAYAFVMGESTVVRVPFMPLAADMAEPCAGSFRAFIEALSATGTAPEANPEAVGMESHEIHPVALGGSPDDEVNRALIPAQAHAEITQYWNKVHRRTKVEQPAEG